MKLGKHVSIAGGIDKAPKRAKDLGCNCLQIFSKNPRGWKARHLPEKEIEKVKNNLTELNMKPMVVHDTYLVNPASPKEELWNKSLNGLEEDYTRTGQIGAEYLVVHPGSHTGEGKEYGIKRIADALNIILSRADNQSMLLLENVAGSGTSIGSKFAELYDIIKNVDEDKRVGVCLDTCHAYAAGYDISNSAGVESMLKEFEQELGLDRLKVIHINDSKHPLNSNKDEHAHIGEGYIGLKGFESFLNHPKLADIPLILETPQFEGKDQDVETIFSLRKD